MNWIGKLPDGIVKDVLVIHEDQIFAQDAARRYLEADDDTKDDIEAFFLSNGPEMMRQAKEKHVYGTPTSEELQEWLNRS